MTKKTRAILVAALSLGCVASYWINSAAAPEPPAPAPVGGLVLRGLFVGPSAASDSLTLGCLCDSLADAIEWDGQQAEPRLKTGASFDDLRICAREARLRGDSIGARQPKARDEIERYMVEKLGTYGGPIDAAKRAEWVAAFREIARAATNAAR